MAPAARLTSPAGLRHLRGLLEALHGLRDHVDGSEQRAFGPVDDHVVVVGHGDACDPAKEVRACHAQVVAPRRRQALGHLVREPARLGEPAPVAFHGRIGRQPVAAHGVDVLELGGGMEQLVAEQPVPRQQAGIGAGDVALRRVGQRPQKLLPLQVLVQQARRVVDFEEVAAADGGGQQHSRREGQEAPASSGSGASSDTTISVSVHPSTPLCLVHLHDCLHGWSPVRTGL